MTYKIQTATYADGEKSSMILLTDEAGLVLISSLDTPDEWAELLTWGETNTIGDYVPPPEPPYRLYKSVFISRLHEIEAKGLEVVLGEAPAKLRLMFNSVEYFVSDDPLFLDLYEAIASVLGPYRATQLLEPES